MTMNHLIVVFQVNAFANQVSWRVSNVASQWRMLRIRTVTSGTAGSRVRPFILCEC